MAGVSIGTGFAANVGSDAVSGLWNKFLKVVKLIRGLPTAVRDMNVQVQRLKAVKDDINADLAQEQRNARRIVQNWLDKAGRAIESSESINNDYEQHKSCLVCCPNCLSRYRISKDITAWNLTVVQLHSEKASDFPSTGEYGDPTPPIQIPIQHPEFLGTGIENAQSKLESWLTEDTNIRVIGVCGMGGVGKTSLLQTINNSQKVGQSFAPIIWLTFSREYDILNLQDCMASKLGLKDFPKSNFEGRKHKLFTCLRNKKFLLILDDMWMSEDLESLGVPLNDTAYKIVLSTRSQVVCKQMKVDQMLRVKPLSEEEGWQLFCKTAFQNGNVPQELEVVAKKIAGECKGLPLAIKVVAAGMANYSYENEWEHALHQMQNLDEAFYVIHDEIEKELFQCLKWSYNALPEDLKTCFLYFAAYPEDSEISCEQVIDIWIAEGLVKGNPESYLPDTAHTFINFLRDRCLIEVVNTDMILGRIEVVKMHDILRDLGIRIAETEHRCYFKAGQGMSHFPLEEVGGKGCARLSLMYNRLDSLPTTFACSSLSVLLLRGNHRIQEVSGSFLGELSALKVLDLSETGITSLPPSIGNLKHLASLQLEGTKICELPDTIGDLKNLQFLNVSSCQELGCLPERITELKRLRVLNINCSNLSHLPRGISELISLEILRMEATDISMDFEEDANVEIKCACLKDLQSLYRLRSLEVKMKSPIKEGVLGSWSKMRALSLSFDDHVNQEYLPQDMQGMKDLEVFSLRGSNVERLPSWVSELQRLRCLILSECNQLRELELGMGFPKLQHLALIQLESLECVSIASGGVGLGEGVSALPMLKSLSIYECEKLKTLAGRWDKLECLEHLHGQQKWWDAMQWEDPNMKSSLEGKFINL